MSRLSTHAEIARRLGYSFRDPSLLELALTHRSWANEQDSDEHYERTEFLGDAVLGLVVAEQLYRLYPQASEGELSKLKSQLVSEPMLARWAEDLALGEALLLGVGERRSGGHRKPSLLADVMEAVLGAVFLDGGFAAAAGVTSPWLSDVIGSGMNGLPQADAKTALQERLQAAGQGLPVYHHVREEGPDHRKQFFVECWLGDRCLGKGSGATKKRAEQRAAFMALEQLERE